MTKRVTIESWIALHYSGECAPWPREQAESFVFGEGFAPSIVIANGKVMSGVEFVTQPTTRQGD